MTVEHIGQEEKVLRARTPDEKECEERADSWRKLQFLSVVSSHTVRIIAENIARIIAESFELCFSLKENTLFF